MAKKMYVVFCEDDSTYWCGHNTWDKQLRKAKVFHSLKYANEVAERYKWLKLRNVEIRMEIVQEHPSNADRIRAMSHEEKSREFVFFCPSDSAFRGEDTYGKPHYTGLDGKYYSTSDEVVHANMKWLQQPAVEVKDA